jgi:hypothetical protein
MDIETMCFEEKEVINKNNIKLKHRKQTPVLITCTYKDKLNRLQSFYKLADTTNFNKLGNIEHFNLEKMVKDLWKRFFIEYRRREIGGDNITCFMHNLGNFDGYFLLLGITEVQKYSTKTTIDQDNNFVEISNKENLGTTFKDSLRLCDVPLNQLCDNLYIPGKLGGKYDNKINNPEILKDPILIKNFIEYGIQDTMSLYKVLDLLQNKYLSKYYVDICDI